MLCVLGTPRRGAGSRATGGQGASVVGEGFGLGWGRVRGWGSVKELKGIESSSHAASLDNAMLVIPGVNSITHAVQGPVSSLESMLDGVFFSCCFFRLKLRT